jgi:hypothetical protein
MLAVGLDMKSRERYALNPFIGKDAFYASDKYIKDITLAVVIIARNDMDMFNQVIAKAIHEHPEAKAEAMEFANEVARRVHDDDFEKWVYEKMTIEFKKEARLCF